MVIFYNFSRKRKMKKLNLIKIVFHKGKGDFFEKSIDKSLKMFYTLNCV